jgi:hypothetical protein
VTSSAELLPTTALHDTGKLALVLVKGQQAEAVLTGMAHPSMTES